MERTRWETYDDATSEVEVELTKDIASGKEVVAFIKLVLVGSEEVELAVSVGIAVEFIVLVLEVGVDLKAQSQASVSRFARTVLIQNWLTP